MKKEKLSWLKGLSRSWFGMALLALVLLAIPGFWLFGLNVFGGEANANQWLQSNFKLTYHIPLAWWLALILLMLPVLVVLLYFLKLKRKPLSVPSTFLWKKSIEDLHVNALFQWLRQNLLLLLQLLTLLFLIYAIMDFRVHGRSGEGRHYIIMIDNSASMSATDVEPSRLHWAKQEALKEVEAATDTDFGMVIVFNSSAEILQSYTNNRGQLRSAIEHIEQSQRPTRIEEALSLADSLANPKGSADDSNVRPADVTPGSERTYVAAQGISTDVHLFSDGRFPDAPEFGLGNLNMHFHLAGIPGAEHTNNIALVTFSAARDDLDPTKMQVFTRALNFSNAEKKVECQLEIIVNGNLKGIKHKMMDLAPRKIDVIHEGGKEDKVVRDTPGEQAVTFELSDVDDRADVVLHAKLKDAKDHFALDDEAWLVVGVVRKGRVLIVTESNEILHAFFDEQSTRAVADVKYMSPAELTKDSYIKASQNGEYDLIVYDRCAPPLQGKREGENEADRQASMPRANTFFIGAVPPGWKKGDKLKNPAIRGWMGKHPVMRFLVALQEIGIIEAFKIEDLPPRTPRLIESDQNSTLLLTLSRQSFTDLVMAFPILDEKNDWNTNWPLSPSFPLFLRNVLYSLGNISDGASEETVQPGQPKSLRPDQAVSQIEVTDPAGGAKNLNRGTRADFSYGDTNLVGVYRVAWNDAIQRSFAVNLLDAEESNIEPRQVVQIGAGESISGVKDRSQPRELWKWMVAAALGLLLLEWYIYNRRVYV